MRHASGPVLRPSAVAAPGGAALPALGLAALALVAVVAGLSAGAAGSQGSGTHGPSRPVAELVTPTPGVLLGGHTESVGH